MRQRSCQTALRVARVPRGIRAMPAKEKPRVSRGDDFLYSCHNHSQYQHMHRIEGIKAVLKRFAAPALFTVIHPY